MPTQSDNQPDVFTLEKFSGLNQQSPRGSIDDQEEFWNENLFAIGPGNLRTCWGPSDPIYDVTQYYPSNHVVRIFFGYYGKSNVPEGTPDYSQPPPGRMGWLFIDNGCIDEVDLDTGTVTHIGGLGFQVWNPITTTDPVTGANMPKYWASAKVWRPRWVGSVTGEVGGVLFGSPGGMALDASGNPTSDPNPTNFSPGGLWAWDGTNLFGPGDDAPDWLTNADQDPAPGTTVMPWGLPGIYCMEIYENRLWVAGKNVISFSKPGNGSDFAAVDGGGTLAYFGDKLVHDYVDLAASSGYLFCFGDSSTDMISNVQMTGGTATGQALTTLFNYQNVDPQVGQRFPRPVGHWGRYFTLYNGAGVFFMQGGDAQEIGQKVQNIYVTVDNTPYYPTMAPATMYGFRVMLFNGTFVDPWGVKRNLLLMWHGTFWSVASQFYRSDPEPSTQINLTNIASYEDNSVITPYGTDGRFLFRLFDHPHSTMPKRLSTKALKGTGKAQVTIKDFKRLLAEIHDNSGQGVDINGSVTTRGGNIVNGTDDVNFTMVGNRGVPIAPPYQGLLADTEGSYGVLPSDPPLSGKGLSAEIDLISYSPDFVIERLFLYNEERTLFGA